MLAVYEEQGVKVPIVTRVRPEAERSNPEQGEVPVIRGGGLKNCYGQVLL